MTTIDEKRVYSDKSGKLEILVATEIGVVVVDVSADRIGGFGIEHRCTAYGVAVGEGTVAVATDEDVLVGTDFATTGFGPAAAVGFDGDALFAANEAGWFARYDGEVDADAADAADAETGDEAIPANADEWTEFGTVEDVRAIDGPLVAAADGVYRIDDGGVNHAGLDDARDVAGHGTPLVATGDGLYTLGNGWMEVLDGPFRAVASDGERAHAVSSTELYAREAGEWSTVDLPTDEPVVDVAYGEGVVFAVTEAGTFLLDAGDGWRSQALGLHGVAELAVR